MPKLKKNDIMPDLPVTLDDGSKTTTRSLLKGRTVFWVLRYIGCPTCRYDVHMITQNYAEFEKRDTEVFVVMQSDPAHLHEALKDTPVPFRFISDPGMAFYKALQIDPAKDDDELCGIDKTWWRSKRQRADEMGFAHGEVEGTDMQLPAMFIVAADGTVSYAHYARCIPEIPTVPQMLDLLDGKIEEISGENMFL